MGIVSNYLEYRKNKPDYKKWASDRALQETKRIEYIKKNNINQESIKNDVERAKAVLNAVDVMDDFSQSRAEEMEMSVKPVMGLAVNVATYLGVGLAGLSFIVSKNIKKAANTFMSGGNFSPKLLIPAALFLIPSFSTAIIMSALGAKMEARASRFGRVEAISKKLISPKQFAILTDEQNKQVQEITKNLNITEKEAKKDKKTTNGLGILKAIKTIFSGDKENEKKLKELNKMIEKDSKNAKSDKPLSPKQIEEAKKDKQLIQNIVEKIDISSQEYTENVELATDTFTLLALSSGGALGFLTKAILNKAKISGKKANIISIAVGSLIGSIGVILATLLQKEASRVARFKVKQGFMANPDKLIYIDDEKIKNEPDVNVQPKKRENFFKFLIKAYKDNKEYKKYNKENMVQQLKNSKAREQINLTPEQEKRAKQLQNNIFKMFHKADEKSQMYSESTEALSEIVLTSGSLMSMIPGLIMFSKSISNTGTKKGKLGMLASILAMYVPTILLNIITTKEQKSASKVANMLAIKEMDDYKNFADYSDENTLNPDK